MKGPFERLKYDLRRLWECPNCKRRERTDGTVTFRFCPCPGKEQQGKLTVMKLVEEAGHRAGPSLVGTTPKEDAPPQEQLVPVDPTPSELPPP